MKEIELNMLTEGESYLIILSNSRISKFYITEIEKGNTSGEITITGNHEFDGTDIIRSFTFQSRDVIKIYKYLRDKVNIDIKAGSVIKYGHNRYMVLHSLPHGIICQCIDKSSYTEEDYIITNTIREETPILEDLLYLPYHTQDIKLLHGKSESLSELLLRQGIDISDTFLY